MKRFFARLAIILLGKEIFGYLEEEAKESKYQNLASVVTSVKDFVNDIPVSVWQSLRSEASKATLREVFKRHDDRMALTSFKLGMELIEHRIEEDFILEQFEEQAFNLAKEIIIIYTNDNPNNKSEIKTLIGSKSNDLLLASIEQIVYLSQQSEKLNENQKNQIRVAMQVAKGLLISRTDFSVVG